MADLSFQPVATQIKPVQGMSLGEMLNMARGAQAYRQAEQTNPLELQRIQAEANVAQQTQQPRISTAQSQSDTAAAQSQVAQMQARDAQNFGIARRLTSLINDPMIIASEQNPSAVDPVALQARIKQYGKDQADALGIPQERADQLIAPYLAETQNPAGMRNFLKQKLLSTMEQATQAQTLGGVGVSTQPAPAAMPSPAATPGTPGMKLPYPVRSAAQPYIPEPTEAKDQAAGEAYRNSLVSRQSGLVTDRRNVEETIKQAQKLESEMKFTKGGVAGDIERKLRTMVASDDYKMLAKDLANLQISNLRALGQGGNTVAGMDLTRVASGDETVPPGTLIKIARRAQADMTNLDMQADGAEKFKARFGDNNMNVFKQQWNANADSKIFEAMNIIKDTSDPAKQQQELNRLFPDQKQRADFLTKYRNLKKLSETGGL